MANVDPVVIVSAINAAVELTAMLYDAWSKSGGTPEEIAAHRAASSDRLDAVIARTERASPPPPSDDVA